MTEELNVFFLTWVNFDIFLIYLKKKK